MDQASPTAGRSAWRWAAPVVAIGGVAAVVAGTLVVTNNPTADPGVTGKPTPSVGAPKVDRGAVPRSPVPQLRKECQWPNEHQEPPNCCGRVRCAASPATARTAVAVAVASRRRSGPPATAGPNAGKLTRGGPSSTTTANNLGIRVCVTRTAKRGPLGSIIVVADKLWTARPTAAQGLLAFPIVGSDRTRDSSKPQTQGPNEGSDTTRERHAADVDSVSGPSGDRPRRGPVRLEGQVRRVDGGCRRRRLRLHGGPGPREVRHLSRT